MQKTRFILALGAMAALAACAPTASVGTDVDVLIDDMDASSASSIDLNAPYLEFEEDSTMSEDSVEFNINASSSAASGAVQAF